MEEEDTVESRYGIELDLGVEKGLDSWGDIVGMVVAVFAMAMAAVVVVVVT